MCGIAGIYFKNKFDFQILEMFSHNVEQGQANRGPDYFGKQQVTDSLFFYHNRLSIIDLNASFQPISDNNGVLVYNGEIYNYQKLSVNSRIFSSDTNYLLNALGAGSLEFLKYTNSMFGFGYYSYVDKILTLCRDRVGIKQVYYIDTEEVFAFASTIKPLVSLSAKKLNVKGVYGYYQNRAFKAPHTIFEYIKLLESGHYLEYDTLGQKIKTIKEWWRRDQIENLYSNEKQVIENIESLLTESIEQRLISDVPVGVYLSGGIDSGIITSIASKLNPNIEAFSVGFKDKKYDESKYAKIIADTFGVKFNSLVINEKDFLGELDSWISYQDDIVADPSGIALRKISQLAHNSGFKVMLAGEGADELFGGYNSHKRFATSLHLNNYLKIFSPIANSISRLIGYDSRKEHYLLNILSKPRFYGTALIFEPHILKMLFFNDELDKFPGKESIGEALHLDFVDRLSNDLLIRSDRATMDASIECRVPFLAHQIVNYAGKIDENLFLKNGIPKYLIKKIAQKQIPNLNIHRKKVGFDMPINEWIRGPLKDMIQELIKTSLQRDIIDLNILQYLFDAHCKEKINASGKIWAFLSLELSLRYHKK
jgi:asparagine synthase (glutamine-hydrolysing)